MLVRIVSVLLALVVLLGVPGFAQPQYEDFLPLAPPRDPASEPLVPAFGQQLGWTRYLTAVAGRVPTILYTHQSHALALRFPSVWTLIEVQIGDPDSWTLEWRPNLVLVQPAVLGGRTNLTMFFSDGRILQAALVEVSARAAGRHGQVYVGPESWLASQLVATLPDRLRVDAQELALTELLAEPETLVARPRGYLRALRSAASPALIGPRPVRRRSVPFRFRRRCFAARVRACRPVRGSVCWRASRCPSPARFSGHRDPGGPARTASRCLSRRSAASWQPCAPGSGCVRAAARRSVLARGPRSRSAFSVGGSAGCGRGRFVARRAGTRSVGACPHPRARAASASRAR